MTHELWLLLHICYEYCIVYSYRDQINKCDVPKSVTLILDINRRHHSGREES